MKGRFIYIVVLMTITYLIIIPIKKVQSFNSVKQDTILFLQPFDTLDSLMKFYNNLGIQYLTNGDYENAEDFLIKSLEIKKLILNETDRRLGNVYVNLGILYQNTWKFEQALENYRRAEIIYTRIDSNYVDLGSLYVNEAIVYRILGDYSRAKKFCNNAIRIFNRQENIDYEKLQRAIFNLGVITGYSGELEDAINHYKKSILFNRNNDKYNILAAYNNIAICYNDLGNDSLAKQYYILSLKLSDNLYGANSPENALYLMNYGLFLVEKMNDLNYGFNLYNKALEMFLKKYGLKHTISSKCYHNIGEYYMRIRDYKSALLNFQRSLISAELSFNDTSLYSNPAINPKKINFRILETLKKKAETYLMIYYDTGNLQYLNESLKIYQLAIEIIDNIRYNFQSEESRFIISSQQNETFLKSIHIAGTLYSKTKNPSFINEAFLLSEKSRAFSLLLSLRDLEAKEFGGIPEKLINQEKDLFRRLSLYDELIYEEKKKNEPDQLKIELWEEKLFWANQDYDKILNKFEIEFSDYYKLKYNKNFTQINKINQTIDDSKALIEYSIIDSNIYIFTANSSNYELFKKPVDSAFYSYLNTLTLDISHPNFSSGVHEAYRKYTDAAYELYKVLIEPCAEMIRGKSLVIIPDGTLSYLPFEALLTHPVRGEEPDYRNLPYLVRDYDIGYSYSATLHFEGQRKKSRPAGTLLAFAPDYSNLFAQNITDQSYLGFYRDQLVPIPGVKDEVRMIARLIRGDVYVDNAATENNFKKLAPGYDILHLAMHTIVDNENPMYSKLAFTQNIDSLEDGFLNTYEIYNMKYDARMAVLSSCKTGYGKLQKGEGVMSLARGFMYAGCPSIIMTLWEVSDKSGARLMQDFYRGLKRGKSKTQALREAKLEFLKKTDQLKANPYFWSTYVAIGDQSPLFPSQPGKTWIILAAILVISAGFTTIWYFKVRQNRKEKNTFRQDSIYT